MSDPVKITIDGREVAVPAGELLIKAAEENGTYIPRFCWHSRMEPVGMCRMCLVEVETTRGKGLTTACTMRVAEGMVVHTKSDVVKKAQEGVLEFLLVNHPLDCPVCDKGGECPLQDQTLSHGPGESRFVEEKRHFEKPIPISDLVLLDRERCILCARCTRFSAEISGDPLIEFLDRGNYTQVNTFPDAPFSSYFSGNTVQICPVGALTATPFRFKARPWDLEAVESTCSHCSVGCRVSVHSSQNQVVRLVGADVEATNQGWLCDKGRFGFEHLRAPARVSTPLLRGADGELHEATWSEALDAAAEGIRAAVSSRGVGAVAGLGGARSTNEEAYAFAKLLRGVIGTGNLDASLGDDPSAALLTGVPRRGTIADLEKASTILVWGPDLKEELPVLYLRVRRAATKLGATLIVVHPRATGLDPDAAHTVRYRPGEGGALLKRLAAGEGDLAAVRTALGTGPVVVIVGRTGLAESASIADAVAAFALELPDAVVLPVARRANLLGALDMGMSPGLLPGRLAATDATARDALAAVWGTAVAEPGHDAAGILSGVSDGSIGALLLLGCDPFADRQGQASFLPPKGGVPRRGVGGDGGSGAETAPHTPGVARRAEGGDGGPDAAVHPRGLLEGSALPAAEQAAIPLTEGSLPPKGGVPRRGEGGDGGSSTETAPPTPGVAGAASGSPSGGHSAVTPSVTGENAGATSPFGGGNVFIVSLDLFINDSNRHADVVLPVDGFAEVEGTFTNLEGRVQKVNRLVSGVGGSRAAVEVLDDLATRLGGTVGASAAAIAKEVALVAPAYAAVSWEALDWGAGRDGIIASGGPFTHTPTRALTETAPTGFALHLARVLYDSGTLMTVSESLAPLAPEPAAHLHPDDATRLGVTTADRVTITGDGGTATLPVVLDPTLALRTVYVPFNLGAHVGKGIDVKVDKA